MRPPLKYYGGKWKHANKIIKHFPPHDTYIEPYGGGANILLRKTPCETEVYNDIYGDVVNFFRMLRDYPRHLIQLLVLTPYSRDEYISCMDPKEDSVFDNLEQARRFFVRSWQMMMGEGTHLFGEGQWKRVYHGNRISPGWDDLWQTAMRLREVQIENTEALTLIQAYDAPDTLFYIDPPYFGQPGNTYLCKMNEEEHIELSNVLHDLEGYVVISGIKSKLYTELYKDWITEELSMTTAKSVRTEILIKNFQHS